MKKNFLFNIHFVSQICLLSVLMLVVWTLHIMTVVAYEFQGGTVTIGNDVYTVAPGGGVTDSSGKPLGVLDERGVFTDIGGGTQLLSEQEGAVINLTTETGAEVTTIVDGHSGSYLVEMTFATAQGADAYVTGDAEALQEAIDRANAALFIESSGTQSDITIRDISGGFAIGCINVQNTSIIFAQNPIPPITSEPRTTSSDSTVDGPVVIIDPEVPTNNGGGSDTHARATLNCADWDGSVYGIPEGYTEGTFVVGGNPKSEQIAVDRSGCSLPSGSGDSNLPPQSGGSISASERIVPIGTQVELTYNTGGQQCLLKYGGTAASVQSPVQGNAYGTITQVVTVNAKTTYTLQCPLGDVSTTVEVKPRIYES